jgi:ubiquinone/menaquinone biosynthesis C-methylase UbiE
VFHFDASAATWDQDAMKRDRAGTVGAAIAVAVPVRDRNILEYGCGTGLLGFALQPTAGRVTLADTSEGMLAVVKEKIAAAGVSNMAPLRLDLLADPLPSGRYDLVCSLMALHHIPDTEGILRKFHEVLAPGGWVALSDLDAEDGSFHGAEVTGVHRGFDRAALARQMSAAGFQDVHLSTVFELRREIAGKARTFPLFLAVGRRA